MGKWKRAFGLGDKKVEQSLAQLSMDQADLSLLVEPSAEQPMVGHAQQHSALTRLANETNADLIEVGETVDRNTAAIEDISDYLGGVYFEVSLGNERWTFDTQAVPAEGNFTAFSYLFDEYNTEFWINKIPAGYEETGFETARPGDKMLVKGQADKTEFGNYIITSILLDNNNVWQVKGDFVSGWGRMTPGRNYEIEIIHISQQFENNREDGSPQIATTDYVDAGLELKLDNTGGDITGKLSVFDEIFLNGGNGKQNIDAKEGYAGKLKYAGIEKITWGGNEVFDECGVCGGDNSSCTDCAGVPNGDAVEDNCGTCDNNPENDCPQDCAGVFGGDSVNDECGTCDNDPSNDCIQDCAGTWGGNEVLDECGVCGGDNSSCTDWAGVPNGNAVVDDGGTCEDDPANGCIQDCAGG